MSVKEQFTPGQWKLLFTAPISAATYVSLSTGGMVELMKELIATGKFIAMLTDQGPTGAYGEIVDALLIEMKNLSKDEAKNFEPSYSGSDKYAIRQEMKRDLTDAAAAVTGFTGADGFGRFVVDSARTAAVASRGGFLGIGAKANPIDQDEQRALDEIAALFAAH